VFERFTEPARQVVVLAQDEARELGHDHIGGAHFLVGLLRLEDGLAARSLASLGVGLDAALSAVVRLLGRSESPATGQIPFSQHAVETLNLAARAADAMGHGMIGTEHLLIGLIDAGDGEVEEVLIATGTTSEQTRVTVLALLSGSA
jgi:ATP-dependent Clp protease ATP-binding subunit ClpC